jgi:preprotein translocase subunit SecB
MKHSPLQLLRYLVPDVSCTANPGFSPQKPFDVVLDQFSVNAVVTRQSAPANFPRHSWSVEMTVSQKLKEGQNFPYKFEVALVGFFACQDGLPAAAEEDTFVRINGSSMLYGAARELVRSLTSRGPWGELFLPSISFYDNKPKPEGETPVPAPQAQPPVT